MGDLLIRKSNSYPQFHYSRVAHEFTEQRERKKEHRKWQ